MTREEKILHFHKQGLQIQIISALVGASESFVSKTIKTALQNKNNIV